MYLDRSSNLDMLYKQEGITGVERKKVLRLLGNVTGHVLSPPSILRPSPHRSLRLS